MTTLVLDVLLKPILQPRVEAWVEDWKRRQRVIRLTDKWRTNWDEKDEYDGLVGPSEIEGTEPLREELIEFRFQHHHVSKHEAAVARSLIWVLAEEWNETLDGIGAMDVRDEILNCGCKYLTTSRQRWLRRRRVYQDFEDWRRVFRQAVDEENVDIPLP
ncbi:hypothetical protein [Glycomyces arizonensis]|uniref:hypothetical protein n=1 Tax=Glycomyces arizonensis TaxID=256035 RepID=UPI0012EBF601|nr:hypothetical protein [Glycomyces arizonensis]